MGVPNQLAARNRERQARAEERRRAIAILLKSRVERSEITRQIAEKYGCQRNQVSRDITLLIQRWREESRTTIEEWKARELAELDDMELRTIRGFDEAIVDDDASAGALRALWIYRRLQVKERRAKLLGLDAPTRIDLTDVREAAAKLAASTGIPAEELIGRAKKLAETAGLEER